MCMTLGGRVTLPGGGAGALAREPEELGSAAARASDAASGFALDAIPNPSRAGETRFVLRLPAAVDRADLEVFDVSGRRTARLFSGPVGSGQTEFTWDGVAADARAAVPPGVYFLRFQAGDRIETRRFVIAQTR
jgi:hypothetical protein